MNLTKHQLGMMIKQKIEQGEDAHKIGQWASSFYFRYGDDLSPEVDSIIYELCFLEEGPEFELSKNELALLVQLLIQEENDPFELVRKMNPKYAWNTPIQVDSNAPNRFSPGSRGVTQGLRYVDSEKMAETFGLPFDPNIDTHIYLVKFDDGSTMEIPKCYLSPII